MKHFIMKVLDRMAHIKKCFTLFLFVLIDFYQIAPHAVRSIIFLVCVINK